MLQEHLLRGPCILLHGHGGQEKAIFNHESDLENETSRKMNEEAYCGD